MRLKCFRFRLLVTGVALAAAATGWVLCARQAAAVAAGPLDGSHAPGGLVVVGTAGLAAGAENPDSSADAKRESWERQLDRVERNRLITIVVFLGAVLLVLLFWWSWGKLHHRARKL
jgi:hypothetical protein